MIWTVIVELLNKKHRDTQNAEKLGWSLRRLLFLGKSWIVGRRWGKCGILSEVEWVEWDSVLQQATLQRHLHTQIHFSVFRQFSHHSKYLHLWEVGGDWKTWWKSGLQTVTEFRIETWEPWISNATNCTTMSSVVFIHTFLPYEINHKKGIQGRI